ncbi:MarR family winged helix-turn-helix transcriptional regulator [Thermogemmatispora onikobensis]|uniref:MarR family winged helix-turn-helix transcriptional regulator n=1 Tax=Thermogemmatispora onikobensis TaxID=732234 RepID=UPI000852DDF3|nr:MarR family transcriptional regulator [Thermogemmatispora onikobensis]
MASERLVEDLLALWRLLRRSTHPVRRAEMTPEQYWLLKSLSRRGTCSVGELASALGLSGSSVTSACKRLEKAGLVRRVRQGDGGDERVVLVELTARGTEQVAAWQRERRAVLSRMLEPLTPDEQDELQRLIERVLAAAESAVEVSGKASGGEEGAAPGPEPERSAPDPGEKASTTPAMTVTQAGEGGQAE